MLSIAEGRDSRYLTKQVAQGAENYYLKAIEQQGEPAGVWLGRGADDLGLSGEVDPKVMETLFDEWKNPETGEQLGRAPMKFKPLEERLAAALAKEPNATPERRAEIERKVTETQRGGATKYIDLTFSAPKSWSLLHAGFQAQAAEARAAGDMEAAEEFAWKADQVWAAQMDGVQQALDYLQDHHETRVGYHGRTKDGESSGRWQKADRLIATAFRQHTSRNDDPQMHIHTPVLNKAAVIEVDPVTGEESTKWLTLDSRGIRKMKPALGAIQERGAEESLYRRLGMRVEMRPDGKAREIVGISEEMRDLHSTRRQQITGQLAEVTKAFEEREGRAPSPYELSCMAQFVTLDSRNWKSKTAPSRAELLERWNATSVDRLRTSLGDAAQAAEEASLGKRFEEARGQVEPQAFDPQQVIGRSVEQLQQEKATFTRHDLMAELNRQLPDCLGGLEGRQVTTLLDQLADQALTPGNEDGVVRLSGIEVVATPRELQRADGTSIYMDRNRYKYATEQQMKAEGRIRAAFERTGAPAVEAEKVEAVISRLSLDEEQAKFVRDVATSGRFLEVLAAPAGAGKSFALSALTEVWEANGGEVIGVTTSRKAKQVLAEEGISNTETISTLLNAADSVAEGKQVEDRLRIKPGQLVIIDEAGMTSNDHIDKLRRLVEEAGGKVLTAGDHRQLTPVEAGGVFAELAEQMPNVHTFEQVRRFRDIDPVTGERTIRQWEADASLQLREGKHEALAEYDARGRFRCGSTEEMTQRAYQGWFADHMAGRNSLLIARTNEQAAELSARARADLVAAGRVEAEGVQLHNATLAGEGDLIQMRKNNARLKSDSGRRWAVNRDVAEVIARSDDGSLTVRYEDGDTLTLPASYVQTNVELAYAGTVHAAQGRTVETCHGLTDQGGTRESFYVTMSRGWGANYGYVITHDDPQPGGRPIPEDEIPHMNAVLGGVLDRSEMAHSANETLRREMEAAGRLDTLTPIWTDLVEQEARQRFGTALYEAMGEDGYRRISKEEAYGSLLRLARHAEQQGHDAAGMLTDCVQERELDTARSAAEAMHWRLEQALDRADEQRAAAERQRVEEAVTAQEQAAVEAVMAAQLAAGAEPWAAGSAAIEMQMRLDVAHAGQETEVREQIAAERQAEAEQRAAWADRTPEVDSTIGQHMRELAEAMDARRQELGALQAEQPEPWAVERLGPVPEDPMEREQWSERAGWIAQYREAYGYDHERDAIGACPGRGAVDARAAWEAAYDRLGEDVERRDVAAAPDAQLREWAERWEREQSWAPPYVAEDLKGAHLSAEDARTRAAQERLREPEPVEEVEQAAEVQEPESELEAWERQMAEEWRQLSPEERGQHYDALAETMQRHADQLEEVHQARQAWEAETREARELADQAQLELDRRRPVEPEPEAAEVEPGMEPTAEQAGPEQAYERDREQEQARDVASLGRDPHQLTVDLGEALESARRAAEILAERQQGREAEEEAERQRRDEGWRLQQEREQEHTLAPEQDRGYEIAMPGPADNGPEIEM